MSGRQRETAWLGERVDARVLCSARHSGGVLATRAVWARLRRRAPTSGPGTVLSLSVLPPPMRSTSGPEPYDCSCLIMSM